MIDLVQRSAKHIQHHAGINADNDHDDPERDQGKHFTAADLGKFQILLIRRTEINALNRPEQIARGEDDAAGAENRQNGIFLPGAEQNQYLRDESRETGQAHGREKRQRGHAGVDRHDRRHAAKTLDVAMMRPVVDHADQKKEHPGNRAVVKHLQHGAVDALGREARHAEHDITHVADTRIRDELLEILLRHGAQRAVNNIPCAERAQAPERQVRRGRG